MGTGWAYIAVPSPTQGAGAVLGGDTPGTPQGMTSVIAHFAIDKNCLGSLPGLQLLSTGCILT